VDTREKHIDLTVVPALLENGKWAVVTGLFDPLTLVQAERLAAAAEHGRSLLVIVDPSSPTLLSADARAALVAALRQVKAVVIADRADWELVLSSFPHVRIFCDEAAERARSDAFTTFVLERQRSAEVLT